MMNTTNMLENDEVRLRRQERQEGNNNRISKKNRNHTTNCSCCPHQSGVSAACCSCSSSWSLPSQSISLLSSSSSSSSSIISITNTTDTEIITTRHSDSDEHQQQCQRQEHNNNCTTTATGRCSNNSAPHHSSSSSLQRRRQWPRLRCDSSSSNSSGGTSTTTSCSSSSSSSSSSSLSSRQRSKTMTQYRRKTRCTGSFRTGGSSIWMINTLLMILRCTTISLCVILLVVSTTRMMVHGDHNHNDYYNEGSIMMVNNTTSGCLTARIGDIVNITTEEINYNNDSSSSSSSLSLSSLSSFVTTNITATPVAVAGEKGEGTTTLTLKPTDNNADNNATAPVMKIQFFENELPVEFKLELNTTNPKLSEGLQGTGIAGRQIITIHNDNHAHNDAVGEVMLYTNPRRGITVGSAHSQNKLYRFYNVPGLTDNDGDSFVSEINLSDLPPETHPDERPTSEDEMVEVDGRMTNHHRKNERFLRRSSTEKEEGEEQHHPNIVNRSLLEDSSSQQNDVIDVYVPYTLRAACSLYVGGRVSTRDCSQSNAKLLMETHVEQAIYESNVVLSNSGLGNKRLRLVGVEMVSSEFDEDLVTQKLPASRHYNELLTLVRTGGKGPSQTKPSRGDESSSAYYDYYYEETPEAVGEAMNAIPINNNVPRTGSGTNGGVPTKDKDVVSDTSELDQMKLLLGNIQERKAALGADIVVFMIHNNSRCGLAYKGFPVNPDFTYTVVFWQCAVGYYSFLHELLHLLGAGHDRFNDGCLSLKGECCFNGADPFCTSYAYQSPSHYFRTLMAYDCPKFNSLTGEQVGCPRVGLISQPDIPMWLEFRHQTKDPDTGNVSYTSELVPEYVGNEWINNRRQIMESWNTVANYNPTVIPMEGEDLPLEEGTSTDEELPRTSTTKSSKDGTAGKIDDMNCCERRRYVRRILDERQQKTSKIDYERRTRQLNELRRRRI